MDSKTAEKVAKQALDSGYAVATLVENVNGKYVAACATCEASVALFQSPFEWEQTYVTVLDDETDGKYFRATWHPSTGKVLFADSWAKVPNMAARKYPTEGEIRNWVASTKR